METLVRPLTYITVVLAALVLLILIQLGPLVGFFAENLFVNLMILGVFLFGIALSFWRLFSLAAEIDWMSQARRAVSQGETYTPNAPHRLPQRTQRLDLLAPFAEIWKRAQETGRPLSNAQATSMVESAQARVDERREFSRYLITALVILGLLGTFWGLLGALGSMREALGNLDPNQAFLDSFSASLTGPLDNMGTAFSSSLFGLAASLFFGFIELQTARAQNTFVEDLETWLASIAQDMDGGSGSAPLSRSGQVFPSLASSDLSANLESLGHLMRRGQQDTLVLNNNLVALLDQMTKIAGKLGTDQGIHEKILATQADQNELIGQISQLIAVIERQVAKSEAPPAQSPEGDAPKGNASKNTVAEDTAAEGIDSRTLDTRTFDTGAPDTFVAPVQPPKPENG